MKKTKKIRSEDVKKLKEEIKKIERVIAKMEKGMLVAYDDVIEKVLVSVTANLLKSKKRKKNTKAKKT